jgi:hypothetical protein
MRLPSFNDFSPKIIGDIRAPLRLVKKNAGNFDAIVSAWEKAFFKGAKNKRARSNITATLRNIGLFDSKSVGLTAIGRKILNMPSAQDAAGLFIHHIVNKHNGGVLIDAIVSLNKRGTRITKESLKQELQTLGIEKLATGTTDHTTLRNWMVEAGILGPKPNFAPDDTRLKNLLGISSEERTGINTLPLSQQIFLSVLRRIVEVERGHEVPAKQVLDECLRDHRDHFSEAQLSAKVLRPLEASGWLQLKGRTGGGRGGRSGRVVATKKLRDIPLEEFVPDFEAVVPADLRDKIDSPPDKIQRLLKSRKKYDRGLGLELLALRMLIDLGLQPRSFRQRSRDTAYAEVDLTAEGASLLFSRWNVQCKCVKSNVSLGDVAKEVGLAIFSKAHVVTMVTTSDFTRDALEYARAITLDTHLQFLFINGKVVRNYLSKGPASLIDHVSKNAKSVMAEKRRQRVEPENT